MIKHLKTAEYPLNFNTLIKTDVDVLKFYQMYKMVLKYNSSGNELSSELKKFRANTARYIL